MQFPFVYEAARFQDLFQAHWVEKGHVKTVFGRGVCLTMSLAVCLLLTRFGRRKGCLSIMSILLRLRTIKYTIMTAVCWDMRSQCTA